MKIPASYHHFGLFVFIYTSFKDVFLGNRKCVRSFIVDKHCKERLGELQVWEAFGFDYLHRQMISGQSEAWEVVVCTIFF